jgi:hypothetical protein
VSAPSNPALGVEAPTPETVAKIRAYTMKIIEVFPDGEDTAVVMCALDGAVALVLHDIGVAPEVFAEGLRRSIKRMKKAASRRKAGAR